jgi:hypothetical protein
LSYEVIGAFLRAEGLKEHADALPGVGALSGFSEEGLEL